MCPEGRRFKRHLHRHFLWRPSSPVRPAGNLRALDPLLTRWAPFGENCLPQADPRSRGPEWPAGCNRNGCGAENGGAWVACHASVLDPPETHPSEMKRRSSSSSSSIYLYIYIYISLYYLYIYIYIYISIYLSIYISIYHHSRRCLKID